MRPVSKARLEKINTAMDLHLKAASYIYYIINIELTLSFSNISFSYAFEHWRQTPPWEFPSVG